MVQRALAVLLVLLVVTMAFAILFGRNKDAYPWSFTPPRRRRRQETSESPPASSSTPPLIAKPFSSNTSNVLDGSLSTENRGSSGIDVSSGPPSLPNSYPPEQLSSGNSSLPNTESLYPVLVPGEVSSSPTNILNTGTASSSSSSYYNPPSSAWWLQSQADGSSLPTPSSSSSWSSIGGSSPSPASTSTSTGTGTLTPEVTFVSLPPPSASGSTDPFLIHGACCWRRAGEKRCHRGINSQRLANRALRDRFRCPMRRQPVHRGRSSERRAHRSEGL